jgi:thymidylate synthase
MTAYMRGNDAVIGLLGDTFAFTFIQEFAARLLGVEVGSYGHHVGSMHINALDLPKVEDILAEHDSPIFPPAPMPTATNWADLRTVLDWEERLRLNQAHFMPGLVALDGYWLEVIGLFEVYRQITHQPDQPIAQDALALLHPGHRWLVEQRWPARMPAAVAS